MDTIVKFNSIQEFNEELKKDRDNLQVSENIVRVTKQFIQSRRIASLRYIHIIATYKTKNNLVKLDKFVGETFENETKADDKASEMINSTELFIESFGLEVRHGMFQLDEKDNL